MLEPWALSPLKQPSDTYRNDNLPTSSQSHSPKDDYEEEEDSEGESVDENWGDILDAKYHSILPEDNIGTALAIATIPSGGPAHVFDVAQFTFEASLSWDIIPKIDNDAQINVRLFFFVACTFEEQHSFKNYYYSFKILKRFAP